MSIENLGFSEELNNMGKVYKEYLPGSQIITCSHCKTHLAIGDDIISRAFHGYFGQAMLMKQVINVLEGPPQDKRMSTGVYRVNDIHCKDCEKVLGWKYEVVMERSQKYKEGKYVLETARIQQDAGEKKCIIFL